MNKGNGGRDPHREDVPAQDHDQDDEELEAEDPEDEWAIVEVPDLEAGGAFRYRIDEGGEVVVEVGVNDPADEERVQWYARGWLDCFQEITEEMAGSALATAFGLGEDEEEGTDDADGSDEEE